MTLAARDERTRLELAQERLDVALARLDNSLSRPAAVPDDNQDLIESLRAEIESLRQDNTALRCANESAQEQITKTIDRLNLLLEA